MSQTDSTELAQKPQKYCQQCGQKTFRPHRSVRELLWEFIENWFGYDSKAYKTAKALCRPASLTLDYFRNAHHHNHYVTPIRLYIFLSIVFFLLTSFGGFNLTNLDIANQPAVEQELNKAVDANPLLDEETKAEIKLDNSQVAEAIATQQTTEDDFAKDCKNSDDMILVWPPALDDYFDRKLGILCEAYLDIQYLPVEKQGQVKAQFWLSIVQSSIESLPQTFLLCLPLLALALKILYIRRSHLYVEHLVLLIHSHSFMFAAILFYLGWHQLVEAIGWLDYVPLGWALLIWTLVYLYLSMKRFYKQGHSWTLFKFITFSIVYSFVFSFIMVFALMRALISL
ncbi:hypothetical protein [Kangiella marina]|uniref:DUF3667 domain-containing protein n=1 Tax=Kangiella marina TaxID=1079178 RepID=A0ABP8IHL4_9GAMM